MVSNSLAKKMIDWVKEGRRTPEEAVTYMVGFAPAAFLTLRARSGSWKMPAPRLSSSLSSWR
jgi:hypothetical protein